LSLVKEIDNNVGDNLKAKFDTPPTVTNDDSGEFKEDEPTIIVTSTSP